MNDPLAAFAKETLASWSDIEKHAQDDWIYRGHRRACWFLETSFERSCDRQNISPGERAEVEDELFREFRRAYHQYATHVPDPQAVVEWLSLMQHYGAPTRLLDFTYSIYIAAYFAVEKATTESAIWAMNPYWALDKSVDLLRKAGKKSRELKLLKQTFMENTEAVVKPLFMEPPYVRAACPLNPFRLNERLRIQKGVFLAAGAVDASFMDNLTSMDGYRDPKNLFRIVIPAEQAGDLRKRLYDMNITRRSLFPGLDGYAQALGVYHPVFDPETRRRRRRLGGK